MRWLQFSGAHSDVGTENAAPLKAKGRKRSLKIGHGGLLEFEKGHGGGFGDPMKKLGQKKRIGELGMRKLI